MGLQAIREQMAIANGRPIPVMPTAPSSGLTLPTQAGVAAPIVRPAPIPLPKNSVTALSPIQDAYEAKFSPPVSVPGGAAAVVEVPIANSTAAAVANTAAIAPPPPGDVMAESYHQNVWIDNSSTSRVGKSHTSIQYTQELESVNLMSNMNIIFIP
jgi:hypothetical protein